jgi:hypothetical protein
MEYLNAVSHEYQRYLDCGGSDCFSGWLTRRSAALEARIEELEKVLRRGRWVHGYMGAEGEVAFLTNAEQLNECEDLVAEDTDVGGFLRWEVEPLTRAEYRAVLRGEEETK